MVALAKPDNRIAQPQGKSNEWYTPAKYIEAAREVMGAIDLDPASCALANQTVKATRYYSKEDDGLSKKWYGRVWLNPPYGRVNSKSVLGMFVARLLDAYYQGDIEQAILLSTARTDNKQLNRLWNFPICFPDHPIRFHLLYGRPSTETAHGSNSQTHMHGSCFVYLGTNEHKFVNTFSEFGRIAKAIDTPRHEVTPITLWEVQP